MSGTMRMKESGTQVLIAGDLHGDLRPLLGVARRLKPRYVLALGDVEPPAPFAELLAPFVAQGTVFKMLLGNHDTDTPESMSRIEAAPEIRLCNRITQIGDRKVAALAGIVRSKEVWDVPRKYRTEAQLFAGARFDSYAEYKAWLKRRTPPRAWADDPAIAGRLRKALSTIFPQTYRQMRSGRAHVLLSHEAGTWAHEHGWQFVDELREALGARAHFFGHHHCRRVRRSASAISVGVGLRGIVNLDGEVIREGELDRYRPDPEGRT